jgi:putative colanic acid biosynthesis glycosyltransferase
MPLFSIITIVRNDSAGFLRTQKSIYQQKFKNFQWVIIDGASTDETRALVLQKSKDESVVVVSESDKGIYDAMNKGLKLSTGQYVNFMNAGDVFGSDNVLQQVSTEITKTWPDFLYGDSINVAQDSSETYRVARNSKKINYGMFARHQSMFYKKILLNDLRFNKCRKISGDYEFTATFLKHCVNIQYLNIPLCKFYEGGISESEYLLGRKENWTVQRDILRLSLIRRLLIRFTYMLTWQMKLHFKSTYLFVSRLLK